MTDREPDPKNPLSPYYPSAVPDVPGNGRTWVALVLSAMLLLGAVYAMLSVFVAI
jgi:hypothetical protein